MKVGGEAEFRGRPFVAAFRPIQHCILAGNRIILGNGRSFVVHGRCPEKRNTGTGATISVYLGHGGQKMGETFDPQVDNADAVGGAAKGDGDGVMASARGRR
jgi:hypothetical protein